MKPQHSHRHHRITAESSLVPTQSSRKIWSLSLRRSSNSPRASISCLPISSTSPHLHKGQFSVVLSDSSDTFKSFDTVFMPAPISWIQKQASEVYVASSYQSIYVTYVEERASGSVRFECVSRLRMRTDRSGFPCFPNVKWTSSGSPVRRTSW